VKKVYFRKLLLGYSGILFVFITIFFAFFCVIQSRNLHTRQLQQDKVLLEDFSVQQDNISNQLINNVSRVVNYNSIITFALSSGSEYFYRMTELQNDLRKYCDGTDAMVVVHKYGDDTCVSNVYSSSIKSQLDEFGMDEADYETLVKSLAEQNLRNRRFVVTDKGLLYVFVTYYADRRMVLMSFSREWEAERDYGNGTVASCIPLDDYILDLRKIRPSEEEKNHFASLDFTRSGMAQTLFDGKSYLAAKSEGDDIIYCLNSPKLAQNYLISCLAYLPFLFVLFVAAFLLILIFSRKLYEPIDSLVGTLMEMRDSQTGETEKNDIDYLVNGLSKIKFENQDLERMMQENYTGNKRRFLSALVQGQYNSDTIQDDCTRFGLKWLRENTYIILLEIKSSELVNESIYSNVTEIVLKQMEETYHMEAVSVENDFHCLIARADDLQSIETPLFQISSVIETVFKLSAVFYVSQPSRSAETLHYSMLTLERIFDSRNTMSQKIIFDYRDLKEEPNVNAVYPISTEQKIITSIENGNLDTALQAINYIFKEYGSALEEPKTRHIFVSTLSITLYRCMQRLSADRVGSDSGSDRKEDIYAVMNRCEDTKQLKDYTVHLLTSLVKTAKERQKEGTDNLKAQIEDYVKENITKDISLITIADAFKITPNYMSMLFRETMGENFKNYTSRIRFETCVEILSADPKITYTDLAEKAGLNNTTTLIRLFKKYAGCSPSTYTQKVLQK
jgi:YesN/AraC family two-component response regulator